MFPVHWVPDPRLSQIHRAHYSTIQTDVMFPGHSFPESRLSHLPSPQGSRTKPQSGCQAIGYHHHTSVIFPGHRFPVSNRFPVPRQQGTRIQTDVMFPGHRIPQSNISHVPRPMLSRITLQSYSQATWFQNQTSVVFRRHRVPE